MGSAILKQGVEQDMANVIVVRGKAGVGKTTLAKALGKRLNTMVVHKDDIYDSVAVFLTDRNARNQICFDVLHQLLQSALSCEADIIIDFGHNHLDDVEQLKSWVEAQNGVLKPILCVCEDETVWAARLDARKANPSPNQILMDVQALKEHYAKMRTGVLPGELVLDTTTDDNTLVERVIAYVQSRRT